MFRYVLSGLVVTAALFVLGAPTPAQASGCPNPFWGIHCGPYLLTHFGLIARATQIREDGFARYGHYVRESADNKARFDPVSDWTPIFDEVPYALSNIEATDGWVGTFDGYTSVHTGFGPVVWGTQLVNAGAYGLIGRWGNYNLDSHKFYPETTSFFPAGF